MVRVSVKPWEREGLTQTAHETFDGSVRAAKMDIRVT